MKTVTLKDHLVGRSYVISGNGIVDDKCVVRRIVRHLDPLILNFSRSKISLECLHKRIIDFIHRYIKAQVSKTGNPIIRYSARNNTRVMAEIRVNIEA